MTAVDPGARSPPAARDGTSRVWRTGSSGSRCGCPTGTGGTFTVTYQDLVSFTLGAMYGAEVWPDLAGVLADLERGTDAARVAASLRRLRVREGLAPDPYTQTFEGFPGVVCTDTDEPDAVSVWSRAGRLQDRRFPYFGRPWSWSSSACSSWPGVDRDRYTGPWNRRTAHPVLVVGNRFDPATRYGAAVRTAHLLGRARLLTVAAWGHTSLFTSRCADDATAAYLLRGRLPAVGSVCRADVVPFARGGSGRRAAAVREVPAVVRRIGQLPSGTVRVR